MGIGTIDPHSHQVQNKIYKVWCKDSIVSKIETFENLKIYEGGHRKQRPVAIHFR